MPGDGKLDNVHQQMLVLTYVAVSDMVINMKVGNHVTLLAKLIVAICVLLQYFSGILEDQQLLAGSITYGWMLLCNSK